MISFHNWLKIQESSPFTRTRRNAALGLGPTIPNAEINSHSTVNPWEEKKIKKRNKKSKRKKRKTKVEPGVDKWLREADEIKNSLIKLKEKLDKK